MLAAIRKALSSWIVVGLLGLLVAAFVLTSVSDPFSIGGSPRLAKVGDQTVTTSDFLQQFDRIFRAEQKERPELTREDVVRAGADKQVLSLLVTAAAFQSFADDTGVTAGAKTLSNAIRTNPAFQIAGQFDTAQYEQVLQQNNMTRREFQELLAAELTRDHFIKVVSMSPYVPDQVADAYVRLLQESRTASIAVVPAAKYLASVGMPDDKAVAAFYKQNIKAYTAPELRSFQYLLLSPAAIEPTIQVSDADAKRYYGEHADVYGGTEKRTLQQLLVGDEQTARQAYSRIQKGEDFVKVAAEIGGFAESDLSLGTLSLAELTKDTSKAAAEAAFGLPINVVSGPVQSELGWHLFRTTAIAKTPGRPFEAVKSEITAKIRQEKALDRIYEISREIEDALASGDNLPAIGKKFGLPVVTVPAVNRFGLDKTGAPVAIAPEAKQMLGQVFDLKQGDEPVLQELGKDQYYAAVVNQVIPSAPRPLDEIKAQVANDWRVAEVLKRAKAEADAMVSAVKSGQPLAAVVQKQGLPPVRSLTVRRIEAMQRNQQLPPPVRAMFQVKQGQAQVVPEPSGQGFFVVKVEKVETIEGPDAPMLKAATKQEVSSSAGIEMASAFANAVRKEVGVEMNQQALDQVRSQLISANRE